MVHISGEVFGERRFARRDSGSIGFLDKMLYLFNRLAEILPEIIYYASSGVSQVSICTCGGRGPS